MFEKMCKKVAALNIFTNTMMIAAALAAPAMASQPPSFGDLPKTSATFSVDTAGPSLIRLEWDQEARLHAAEDQDLVRTLDRAARSLLVAVEEAGRYDFYADSKDGAGAGQLGIEAHTLAVEIQHESFWLESAVGRLAIDRTIFQAADSTCSKSQGETDPDPPSGGGLTVGPPGGTSGSACWKSQGETDPDPPSGGGLTSVCSKSQGETDPDPPSGGGLTVGPVGGASGTMCSKSQGETDPDPPSGGLISQGLQTVASFIEVRRDASLSTEPLLSMAVSTSFSMAERTLAQRAGFQDAVVSSALISRPTGLKSQGETDPDPPHKSQGETDPDPPHKAMVDHWRAVVADDGSRNHLEMAAWLAPLIWSEIARPEGEGPRLLHFELAD